MTGSPGGAYVIMKHRRERRAKMSPQEIEAEDMAVAIQIKRDAKWSWFALLIWLGWIVFSRP